MGNKIIDAAAARLNEKLDANRDGRVNRQDVYTALETAKADFVDDWKENLVIAIISFIAGALVATTYIKW